MAVIIDEHGSLSGVVTLEDLLEELVGEIEDEYDVRESLIRQIDEGLFMMDDDEVVIDEVDQPVQLPSGALLTNDVQNALILEIDQKGRDVEEVVAEWMANNPTVWQPWVAASK